jgi:hypothetical protein
MNTRSTILRGLVAVCLLLASLCFTGCKDEPALIQQALNQILPDNFEGELTGSHAGHYFGASVSFSFNFKGLKKVNGKWTWTEGGYTRTGVFSNGGITLKPSS